MSAQFVSHLDEFRRRHDRAVRAALPAAAQVLVTALKRALRKGFKSGKFVTGRLVNSITMGDVVLEGGAYVIRVGTNVKYALFWELGHINLFTRKHERVEIWRPTTIDVMPQVRAKFVEIYTAMMARPA
jgi:hypothetical protein